MVLALEEQEEVHLAAEEDSIAIASCAKNLEE